MMPDMDVPCGFEPACQSCTGDGCREFLCRVAPDTPKRIYPGFFRTELPYTAREVSFFQSDGREL